MPAMDPKALERALFSRYAQELAPFLLVATFLAALLFGLDVKAALLAVAVDGLPATLALLLVSYLAVGQAMGRLMPVADDVPGARLGRLFDIPEVLELRVVVWWNLALLGAGAAMGFAAGVPLTRLWEVLVVGLLSSALLHPRLYLSAERVLEAEAFAEFERFPLARRLKPSVGLSWLLPLVLLAAIATVAAVAFAVGARVWGALGPELAARLEGPKEEALWLFAGLSAVALAVVFQTGHQLGRRYRDASMELRRAIESLSSGSPRLPRFVASDELGQISFGLAAVFDRLKQMALLLRQGAVQLASSAEQLSNSTARQNETLSRQAAALQETEVTAQEIKQTSLLASQKTEGVLAMAERAEQISKSGEQAVEHGLSGLSGIQQSVTDMATRIRSLGERARQIATITTAVKDLADQSNMLALNAAIEAVRSGEHGKGFSVVAREIRTLADQSIQATNRVREILQDVSDAIRDTVAITEQGAERVQSSLVQVQSTGDSLKALGSIVRDTTSAVRQIAAAVGQQNAGIGEIFEAVKDLSRMMDETLERVQASEEAAGLVRGVAGEVSAVVRQYGVDADVAPAEAKAPKAA